MHERCLHGSRWHACTRAAIPPGYVLLTVQLLELGLKLCQLLVVSLVGLIVLCLDVLERHHPALLGGVEAGQGVIVLELVEVGLDGLRLGLLGPGGDLRERGIEAVMLVSEAERAIVLIGAMYARMGSPSGLLA